MHRSAAKLARSWSPYLKYALLSLPREYMGVAFFSTAQLLLLLLLDFCVIPSSLYCSIVVGSSCRNLSMAQTQRRWDGNAWSKQVLSDWNVREEDRAARSARSLRDMVKRPEVSNLLCPCNVHHDPPPRRRVPRRVMHLVARCLECLPASSKACPQYEPPSLVTPLAGCSGVSPAPRWHVTPPGHFFVGFPRRKVQCGGMPAKR